MANWTTPKTWTFGEVLSSTDMNTYVRDNGLNLRLAEESGPHTSNYTLQLSDLGKVVAMDSASNLTVTVPDANAVLFPVGSVVNVYRAGAGEVSIVGDGGVTVRNAGDIANQFGEVSLRKRDTDEWVLAGQVE